MSSVTHGVGVDFNNVKKPIQYKKLYQYLTLKPENCIEFAYQLIRHPSWHPDKNASLRVVVPILLKALKKQSDQTLFTQLHQLMMRAFSSGAMGLSSPDDALAELRELAEGEEVYYTEKNIANFFGDAFVDTMLSDDKEFYEGNSLYASLFFILNLLKSEDVENLTSDIQKELQYCFRISASLFSISQNSSSERKDKREYLCELIKQDISKLERGESLLLPSGWISTVVGHAMLMKIQRSEGGKFELLVFNTGDGVRNHQQVTGHNKIYYHPVMKFEGLPFGDLCDRGFFEALFECVTEYEAYKSQDIYKGILSRFSNHQVNDPELSKKFITPQRSGTCSARVVMNYIKYHTPSVGYQRLHYRMDKKVLEESLKKYKGKLKQRPQLTKLLKFGAERFARRLLKLEKGSIHPKAIRNAINRKASRLPIGSALSKEEIHEGLKVVNRVLKEVKGALSIPKRTHEAFKTLPNGQRYPDVGKQLHATISDWESQLKESPKVEHGKKLSVPIKFPDPTDIRKLDSKERINYLTRLVDSAEKSIQSGNKKIVCVKLTQVLLDFPIDEVPADKEDAQKLYRLMTRAGNSLFVANSIPYADRLVALYRAYAVGLSLVKKLHPNLGSYPLCIRPLELWKSNMNSLSYFKDVQEKLEETLMFFEEHNKSLSSVQSELFSFHKWANRGSMDTTKVCLPIPESSLEFKYLMSVYENISDQQWQKIDEEYEKNIKGVVSSGITKKEFRISMLWLGSENIPAAAGDELKYFHSLNQFAIITEMMLGQPEWALKECKLSKHRHTDSISPETFFNLQYKINDGGYDGKFLTVELGLQPRTTFFSTIEVEFTPRVTTTSKYVPEWYRLNYHSNLITLPARADTHDYLKKKSDCEMSLYKPFKDVNSSILENKSNLVSHANLRNNLSTHLLKGFLENNLDKLNRLNTRTWFMLSLFNHEALLKNLKDEPQLGMQLLNAFDNAIKITKWQMKNLKDTEIKKGSPTPFLDKYVFLLDMKSRLLSYIPHLDSQTVPTDSGLDDKARYSSSSSSSSSSSTHSITSSSSTSYSSTRDRESYVENLRNQLREVVKSAASHSDKGHKTNFLHAMGSLAVSYESYPPRNEDEVHELLKGLYYCNINAYGSYGKCSNLKDLKHLVYKTVSKHEQIIFDTINDRKGVLTKLLNDLHEITLPSQTYWENHYPVYLAKDKQGNEYRINLYDGTITCNEIPIEGYSHIYKDKMYREAFGEKPFSHAIVSSQQNPAKYTIEGKNSEKIHIYVSKLEKESSSSSKSSSLVLVISTTDERVTRIEKEIDGKLYAFVPGRIIFRKGSSSEENFSSWPSFMKHPYNNNYSTWILIDKSSDTDVKIVDIKQDRVVASISNDGILRDLSHEPRHISNTLIDLSATKIWSCLTQFEDPHYIAAKQSLSSTVDGNITLDFTRYRTHNGKMMRFVSKETNSQSSSPPRLHWEQDPQWFISSRQEISGFPQFKRFLVLENEAGKRKVILPKLTHSDIVSGCSDNKINCIAIEIDTEGNLLPQAAYEYAFCAYHSLMNKRYAQAMVFLQEAHSLQRYSPETLRVLGWILVSEDESPDMVPDALAVRAYAAWLGRDNLYRNELRKSSYKGDKSLYTRYAPPEAWEAYWMNEVYWPNDKAELRSFKAKMGNLYSRYLSVRKAVSADLRVDATRKVGKRRKALLHVDEEIFLINCLGIYSQVLARGRHLLDISCSNDLEVSSNADLSEVLKPDFFPLKNPRDITFIKSVKESADLETYKMKVLKLISTRTRYNKKTFLEIAPYLYQLALSEREEDRVFVADILRDCEYENVTSKKVIRVKSILKYMLVSVEAARKIDSANWSYWGGELENVLKSIKESGTKEVKTVSTPKQGTKNGAFNHENSRKVPLLSNNILTFSLSQKIEKHFLDGKNIASKYYGLKAPNPITLSELPKARLDSQYSRKCYENLFSNYTQTVEKLSSKLVPVITGDVKELFGDVRKNIEEIESQSTIIERQILKIARKLPPKGSLERMKAKLALHGKKKAEVSLDDCILAFIQKSERAYLSLNDILTTQEVQQLHSLVGNYLVIHSNAKHYKRILATKNCLEETAKLLTIRRQYDIEKYPELLVFEYFMGYTLREDQVDDITDFISKDCNGSFPNIFKQRMMGAGKTEVLGTLLALLKADGHHLSIMVAPRSLYTTNAQDIKNRSNRIFGQKATTINFSRSPKEFTLNYLSYIKRKLDQAITDRNFLILPPEVLQALENRYFEAREQVSNMYERLEEARCKANDKNSEQLRSISILEVAWLKS